MSKPVLSILIPTVDGREESVQNLFNKIKGNRGWNEVKIDSGRLNWHHAECLSLPIWITICKDDKSIPIGQKRELMYQMADGVYAWQIDDDDDIADNAIELILEATKKNPCCITFEEYCLMDGVEYKSRHSLDYFDWNGDGSKLLEDGFHFQRSPFYKDVIKTSIANSVPFERIRWAEDHAWSRALRPHLKSEIHIPQQLYKYIHNSSNPTERYGLDK